VLNKTDAVRQISTLETLQTLFPEAVSISAKTALGLDRLHEVVLARYKGGELLLRVCALQSNGKVLSYLRAYGQVLNEQYCDGRVIVEATLGQNQLAGLRRLGTESIEPIST